MTTEDSMSRASRSGKQPISWIQVTGPAPAEREYYEGPDGTSVAIAKPSNSTPSNTSESERFEKKLAQKIQRRLDHQKGVHQLDKDLGELMRVFRSSIGKTAAYVADVLQMSFIHYWELEQGKRSASLSELFAIFKFFGIDITTQIIDAKKH